MAHILKNKSVTLHVDLPEEHYQLSRFDWTGKIFRFEYQGVTLSGHELPDRQALNQGLGFYNEFGIDQPVGFEETAIGDWFHKIGVGLLQKRGTEYDFRHLYPVQPAQFEVNAEVDHIRIVCRSVPHGGYAYVLNKEIRLSQDGFVIAYDLENLGVKPIQTNEYVHNFLQFGNIPINETYVLHFPFQTAPSKFIETVNPESLVVVGEEQFSFRGQPSEPFFFSNLSGDKKVIATWKMENRKQKISLSETGSFSTAAVNLWGSGHVISPELFFQIDLAPNDSISWSRTYQVLLLNP